jgi:hypothetical protein
VTTGGLTASESRFFNRLVKKLEIAQAVFWLSDKRDEPQAIGGKSQ